ncbi:NAD(P)-dependent oxidoreductase [Rhizomonospora bruguierae]|uniref:NAD(P)-dependent oxidoreductase n=1 Tax=Rhizomonospora bruguierae TaxID=1581705 RepID=UPI001BCE5A17|nr:NAD(P)-dependent oxidoreductase [Micromonospora sp. NBRC 107566]
MADAGRVCVAVLGLGEAGGEIARDLVRAGAEVRGYDPAVGAPEGVTGCRDESDAVTGACVVLSVNSAADALTAARRGAPAFAPGAVWADLNTGSAGLKRALAGELARTPGLFADVALMSPVPGRGLRTPMLASGAGAEAYRAVMVPLGAAVEVLPGEPGDAATRKLLRSVFFKGLAAAVVEALAAARAAGCEDWLRANIADELTRAAPQTVDRLERGSRRHAARRVHEMAAAVELLGELGVPARVAAASRDLLAELAAGPPGHTDAG